MARTTTYPGIDALAVTEQAGSTRIDPCCAFDWTQKGILRSVYVDETHHYECVQKLLDLARTDRISVLLVYRTWSGRGPQGGHERGHTDPSGRR